MPKKILYESAVHQFLAAAKRLGTRLDVTAPAEASGFSAWVAALMLEYPGPGALRVRWTGPVAGEYLLPLKGARFYMRGDAAPHYLRQAEAGLTFKDDQVAAQNTNHFDAELMAVLRTAKVLDEKRLAELSLTGVETNPREPADYVSARKNAEEAFHDEWAASVDVRTINVRQRNEACTAPEMRHIRDKLGNISGKTLLDVGCGLGEASVYFAMQGAIVTVTDISPGMCETAQKLAVANGVTVETHVSPIEDLGLGTRQFDIIYIGNTLHHANVATTLDNILPHLKPDGVFVSWDPVAYNPIINLYRAVATNVRTEDEHPLRLRDIREIAARFERAEATWFWFTTLLIFMLMVAVQFRSPNKERFWKKIVDEADTWAWLYWPLAAVDRCLLAALPFLRPLCWNVVIVGRGPKHAAAVQNSPEKSL